MAGGDIGDDGARAAPVVLWLYPSPTAAGDRGFVQAALDQAGVAATVRVMAQEHVDEDFSATFALQGERLATYVFAGVDLRADIDDLVATVRLYLSSPRGWIEDARPCGRLRHCLRTRLPAPVR